MFLVLWVRKLLGFVKFSARGVFLEKFVSDCANKKVHIWGVSRHDEFLEGFVLASDYFKLRQPAKKNGVRLRVTQRHGAPFFINRYYKRIGVIIGCAVFVLVLTILSNFVWSFEVVGNERVSEDEILSALKEFGLKTGVYIPTVEIRDLQQKMLIKFEDLAWIGINLNSSVAEIRVHERVMPPPEERVDDGFFNVVASEGGQIKKLFVYSGQPVVKVGEAVKEGDLIVSGIVEDPKGNTTIRHARATVMALVPFKEEYRVKLRENVKIDTGKSKAFNTFCVFGAEIPIYFSDKIDFENYYIEESVIYPNIFGFNLPMKVKRKVAVEYEGNTVEISLEEAKKRAFEEYGLFKENLEIHKEIITYEVRGNEYVLICEGSVLKDIAREIEVEYQ